MSKVLFSLFLLSMEMAKRRPSSGPVLDSSQYGVGRDIDRTVKRAGHDRPALPHPLIRGPWLDQVRALVPKRDYSIEPLALPFRARSG